MAGDIRSKFQHPRQRIRAKDADARHIGERSDAVLRTAMAGHDDIDRTLAAELRYIESGWRAEVSLTRETRACSTGLHSTRTSWADGRAFAGCAFRYR